MKQILQIDTGPEELENLIKRTIQKAFEDIQKSDEWLTEREVCDILKISKKVLRGMSHRKKITAY